MEQSRLSYLAAFATRAPRLYVAEQQDRRKLNILMFEAFKGVSRDRLVELGREYCERVLIGHLYPKGVELIEANRRAGLEPVLVTGSPDWVVAPLVGVISISRIFPRTGWLSAADGRPAGCLNRSWRRRKKRPGVSNTPPSTV